MTSEVVDKYDEMPLEAVDIDDEVVVALAGVIAVGYTVLAVVV